MIETTPWGLKPRHLLRDRNAVYGRDFRRRAQRIGSDAIASPARAPKANAIAERVIGTLRRECLDHLIVRNEHHLLSVLREFVAYHDEGAAASNTRTGETEPEGTSNNWADLVATSVERSASSTNVLPDGWRFAVAHNPSIRFFRSAGSPNPRLRRM
jgi:transposase InsO family protein